MEISNEIPCDNKFQAVLLAGLRRECSEPEEPKNFDKQCRKCKTSWDKGYFSVVMLPPKQQCWKQIERYKGMGKWTKQQKSLVKYLETRTSLMAKYTCGICSSHTLAKLKAVPRPPVEVVTPPKAPKARKKKKPLPASDQDPPQQKPKKGTIKRSAGLTMPAEKAASAHNEQSRNGQRGKKSYGKFQAPKFEPKDFRVIQRMLATQVPFESRQGGAPAPGKRK